MMAEFNVTVSSPLLAYNLYEMSNRLEDCEGLIFGSYRCKRRSNVDDADDRTNVVEHAIVIKKFIVTGVRNTFYDQIYRTDAVKLTSYIVDVDEGGRLEFLGWYVFNRVISAEFLPTYAEICRQLNSSKQTLNESTRRRLDFPWGGPLFLTIYERLSTDNIKLDIGETKYQMYFYNSASSTMKKLKLKILNVGDTSHVDYASIDVQNTEGYSVLSQLASSINANLVADIEKNVTDLSVRSTKSVSDAVDNIQMSELRLTSTTNGVNYHPEQISIDGEIQSNFNVYQSPCGSWEIVNSAATDAPMTLSTTATIAAENRGQKREKGDQSCSSSGNNSDELDAVMGVGADADGHQYPTLLTSSTSHHYLKKSRGPTGDAIGTTSSLTEKRPPKGRSRTVV